ncbi:hypothetical protein M0805_004589 [Coniferiporia weirii]|nr:hypothetical protein M0805_004589 [Coniferiporia weirii]
MLAPVLLVAAGLAACASAQSDALPNSFPHDYPGKPKGGFSPEYQDYFLVKEPLPNVTFPLSRGFAGNIGVNRENHPNDTLFFWAFESKPGSLTASEDDCDDTPWAIWLNGGPGASSLLGLLLENGPLHVTESGSMTPNNYSWDKLVDYVWVDQPVGTGFSTADSTGYVADEDQMGEDFVGFLTNLVKVFPSLAKRPLLLTGESYAGTYIPYIMKAIFSTEEPPVNVSKVAMGNAAIGTITESEEMTALTVIATYPQTIGYDPEVYEYFKEQAHLCGFDLNLTYPQVGGHFHAVNVNFTTGLPLNSSTSTALERSPRSPGISRQTLGSLLLEKRGASLAKRSPHEERLSARALREREVRREAWKKGKRDLSGRANGTIDPWYGCFLSDEATDYALNFSLPWSAAAPETIDPVTNDYAPYNPYDLPDARKPAPALDPTTFLNDDVTRAALHAPTSKNWSLITNYPFNNTLDFPPDLINPFGDPSLSPSGFFDEFAANTTAAGIPVIIFSGNDDSVVAHFASEVVIQARPSAPSDDHGFTQKPQTAFTDDDGKFLGVVHQERNWTYILVEDAGHEVSEYNPSAALVMFREFIVGANQTGLVLSDGSIVGGTDPTVLQGDVLPGQESILFGSGTATSLFVAPSATIAAWESFYSTAAATPSA